MMPPNGSPCPHSSPPPPVSAAYKSGAVPWARTFPVVAAMPDDPSPLRLCVGSTMMPPVQRRRACGVTTCADDAPCRHGPRASRFPLPLASFGLSSVPSAGAVLSAHWPEILGYISGHSSLPNFAPVDRTSYRTAALAEAAQFRRFFPTCLATLLHAHFRAARHWPHRSCSCSATRPQQDKSTQHLVQEGGKGKPIWL